MTKSFVTEAERRVASSVLRAVKKGIEEEDKKFAEDIVQPLELGPQRYTDPAIWGPDYKTLPEDSPERLAWESGNPLPLTVDRRWQAAGELVDKLDAAVGDWPRSK